MGRLNTDPSQAHTYKVEMSIPGGIGTVKASFSKISGLSEETESVEWRYGDEPPVKYHLAGLTTYGDVTFEDGLDPDDAIRRWRELLVNTRGAGLAATFAGEGLLRPEFGTANETGISGEYATAYWGTIYVSVFARDGQKLLRDFTLLRVWPTSVEVGDLDSLSSDIVIRSAVFKVGGLVDGNMMPKMGNG